MEFKKGDIVQAIKTNALADCINDITAGNYYKVIHVRHDVLEFIDDQGDRNGWGVQFFRLAPWCDTPLWKILNERKD
jgi:hypothetical protein